MSSTSRPPAPHLMRDISSSAVAAGLVTVLVGFASSVAIVFQAAQSVGATSAQTSSWILALCTGTGLTSIGLSLRYRMPVVTAWSTPGAAMLTGAVSGLPLSDAIGAFLISAALASVAGFSGLFDRMTTRIPPALASGMLAGVLLRFGLDAFDSAESQPALMLAMFATYLLARRWLPRYAVLLALLAGLCVAGGSGFIRPVDFSIELSRPAFVAPTWSIAAVLGIALPLFLVTMASQNAPGLMAIRASGFRVPASHTVGWIGVVNVLLAPFGAFALNLAAITAAICLGREAHELPQKRYIAAVAAGVFYLIVGVFGATVTVLLGALPGELVVAIAGIALLGTIGNSLAEALRDDAQREPAVVTLLATASGVSLLGIGSAFWGVIAGVSTDFVLRRRTGTESPSTS